MRTKVHTGRLQKLLDLAQTTDRIHMETCGECLMARAYDDKKRFPKMPIPFGGHPAAIGGHNSFLESEAPAYFGLTVEQYEGLINNYCLRGIKRSHVVSQIKKLIANPSYVPNFANYKGVE